MYPFILYIGRLFHIDCYNLMGFFGIYIALGLLVIFWKEQNIAKRWQILVASILAILVGSVGASITNILLHLSSFKGASFTAIIFNKERAVLGFFLFMLITYYLILKHWKIPFKMVMDHIIGFVAFGRVFGRVGCLLAGCCHGTTSSLPWAVYFGDNILRHPTQAYMVILVFAIFIATRVCYTRLKKYPGLIFFSAISMYSAGRFLVEFLRTDSPQVLGMLKLSHIAMIILFICGLIGMRNTVLRYQKERSLITGLLRMYSIFIASILLISALVLSSLVFLPKVNRTVPVLSYIGSIVPKKNIKEAAFQHERILNLNKALNQYKADNGIYPTNEQGLSALIIMPTIEPVPENWQGPYLKREYIYKNEKSYAYKRFKVGDKWFYKLTP